jgi:hypothetical protein
MKVNDNEIAIKNNKVIKNKNTKINSSEKNELEISTLKMTDNNKLKKNNKYRLNSSKNINNNFKKSFDSKNSLRQNLKKPNLNNGININTSKNIRNSNIHKKNKAKINIRNKENISKKRNNENYNSNDNLNTYNINKTFYNITKKIKNSKQKKRQTSSEHNNIIDKENKKYPNFIDSENNNHKHNYNVDSQSEKHNIFIEENENKQNINNFCYDSGSRDNEKDIYDQNENKIVFRCDDYSLFTFGNSFSYSNSKRSKSTKRFYGNDISNNIDVIDDSNKNSCFNLISQYNSNKNNNNYVNKLKEENENLKKELKESNEQITFLMYKINELKQNKKNTLKKSIKDKISPANLWEKKIINFDIEDKENYNSYNHNDILNLKITLDNKTKNKKDLSKDIIDNSNNIKGKIKCNQNKKYINNNKKDIKNIKHKKIKTQNKSNSHYSEKTGDKINEYISMIKI